jgi:hypothetical protein
MSYIKAMRWNKKHPKGTRQPLLMSSNSGFWPSTSFLTEDYWPYLEKCKSNGINPLSCEQYYKSKLN